MRTTVHDPAPRPAPATDTDPRSASAWHGGFSLLELVVVIVIMAVVTAVALPRMTRSADNADRKATRANYVLLNKALGFYAAEHGGRYPSVDEIERQLTMYSNADGTRLKPEPDEANGVVHGPYLLRIPAVSIGPHAGENGIAGDNGPGIGWLYDEDEKTIIPNLLDRDDNLPGDFDWRDWLDERRLDDLGRLR